MKKYRVVLVFITALIVGVVASRTLQRGDALKIGVITPLTGNSAYWGESTLVGVKMAEVEFVKRGTPVRFIVEDGELESKPALDAAQKLVHIDGVQAIYSEFNPASVAVASFLKGKDIFHLYDSAAASPLANGPNNFKTYLDYEASCRKTAVYLKEKRRVVRVGVLKMNIEFGDLCLRGIESVFGDSVSVESYDPIATDFRAALTKLRSADVDAVFQATFQPQTLATIRQMHELGMRQLFVGLAETMTPEVRAELGTLVEGDVFFGLPQVAPALVDKIRASNGGKDVANENAAALAYVHLVQLGTALTQCGGATACVEGKMASVPPVQEIGFEGFRDRVAAFATEIDEVRNGTFVHVP